MRAARALFAKSKGKSYYESVTKSKESEHIPLWSHQSDALDFVKSKFDNGSRGCLLGMEMGTGKTRVAIEFLAYALSNHSIKKILVVAPKSVVCVWESEIEKVLA